MEGKRCQPWHALGDAMSHVQSLLWQKMQPDLLQAPERAQVVAGVNWAQGNKGRTEGESNIFLFKQQRVVKVS